jgi:hypothetical protein
MRLGGRVPHSGSWRRRLGRYLPRVVRRCPQTRGSRIFAVGCQSKVISDARLRSFFIGRGVF